MLSNNRDRSRNTEFSMKILVIDDCADSAEMLGLLLEAHGHSVLLAFSGRSGIELAQVAEPDSVIIDLGLPDMDGIEVIRAVRLSVTVGKCKVLVVTGRGDLDARNEASEAGADCFFVKGGDLGGLLSLVDRNC